MVLRRRTALALAAFVLLALVALLRGPTRTVRLLRDDLSTASSQLHAPHVRLPSSWNFGSRTALTPPSWIPAKPSAAFVILCRNFDLGELLPTLTSLEATFNSHPYASYPYVFLNDEPFKPSFKAKVETYLAATRARHGGEHAPAPDIRWGLIDKERHWNPPKWIDWERARRQWDRLIKAKIPYADSVSYRNMCRWQSGFFFKHALLQDIQYYWRIEPSTRFTCNLVPEGGRAPTSWDAEANGRGDFFDPFRWMHKNDKKYGWVLSLKEYQHTIRSLWPLSRKWMLDHPQYHSSTPRPSLLPFISKPDFIGYNLCHFWTNFEIASLDFFRSEAYQSYFSYLDSTGMFYYERTGDAPVHTIAASWFLGKDEVHQFENIGYFHSPFHACPRGQQYQAKCACNQYQRFDYDMSGYTCQLEWDKTMGKNSTKIIQEINAELGWPNITNFAIIEGYAHG